MPRSIQEHVILTVDCLMIVFYFLAIVRKNILLGDIGVECLKLGEVEVVGCEEREGCSLK